MVQFLLVRDVTEHAWPHHLLCGTLSLYGYCDSVGVPILSELYTEPFEVIVLCGRV